MVHSPERKAVQPYFCEFKCYPFKDFVFLSCVNEGIPLVVVIV